MRKYKGIEMGVPTKPSFPLWKEVYICAGLASSLHRYQVSDPSFLEEAHPNHVNWNNAKLYEWIMNVTLPSNSSL